MNYLKQTFLLSFILLLSTTSLFAQNNEPLADALTEKLKSEVFSVGVLLQSEAYFSFKDDNFNRGRKFDLGAQRIDLRGSIDHQFTYRMQLEFRNEVSILDAQLGYRFNRNHRVVAGAFKPFLSRDLDPSPGDTDFMRRARQVATMMNAREIGVTFLGQSDGFNYRLGMYNGTGLTRQNDNRFLYTARLGYTFDLNGDKLMLGFNGAYDQSRNIRVGNTGLTSTGNRTLVGGFLEYTSDIIFSKFELLATQFETVELGNTDETILGFYGTLGMNLDSKNALLARWDHISYDVTDNTSELITLGWNHQASRLISFQVNALGMFMKGEDAQFGISTRMQFQF